MGKKLLAIILTLTVALTMGVSMTVLSFAASDGKITMDNAVNGEEYDLYKVFDLTYGGDGETNATGTTDTGATAGTYTPVAYTYSAAANDAFLTALQGSSSPFTVKAVSGTTGKYSVVRKTGATDAGIIDFIKTNVSKLPASKKIGDTKTAANNKVEWTGLDYGYYYITSSAGSFVTIDSTIKEVTVKEKNTIPSQDKKQAVGASAPSSATGYTGDSQKVQVGDTVWYQIEVKDGKGTDAAITITDEMTDGLTFDTASNPTVVASINGGAEAAVAAANYEVSNKTAQGFKVTLKADYVKTLTEKDIVYIRFSAVVNSKAASDSDAEKETNESTLTYSNQTSTKSVVVTTYKFQLDKVQDKAHDYADLLGAQFELYRGSKADANKIWFTKGTAVSGVPVLIVAGQGATAPVEGAFSIIALTDDTTVTNHLDSSKVIFKGLNQAAYVLHETQSPEGYNVADDTTVATGAIVAINGTITDVAGKIGADDTAVVSVVNEVGTELPSTGGIGTTIFYILGALLVVVCGIVLVARRRMTAK